MTYSFIFGPSGSGKTTRAFADMIRASLAEPDRRFFILVPEQYSMLMQKKLLELHPRHASGNIEVMSFNRLAWSVFSELGIRNPEVMDDSGKAMVLRRVAAEKAGDLILWKDRLKKAGFAEHVKSMISECAQYGVGPAELRKAAEGELKLPLRQKLADLSVLYEGFYEFIKDKALPKEEVLRIFADHAPESGLLQDAVFLFDGFTGFTPVQYRLIDVLFTRAAKLYFTVTIGREADPYRRGSEEDLFRMSTDMVAKLVDLASGDGVRRGEDLYLTGAAPRFRNAPALDFLERHFLRYDGACYEGTQENIKLLRAAGPNGEAEAAAGEILRLVKKEGYRWRDTAVICADFETEEPVLRHEFERQGIPCYSDRTLGVAANPLSELLRAALGCAAEHFSGESFLRFVKCGLVTDDREETAVCESFMELRGIRSGKKLFSPWEQLPRELEREDLKKLNDFKDGILALLQPLKELFSEREAPVGKIAGCLRELMRAVHAEEKLLKRAEAFAAAADQEHEREYESVFAETERILTEMEELLGDETLGRDDMKGVLEAGLSEIRVGQIPAYADRVVIGDLTRSRLSGIRALFLLGANDGMLPQLKSPGGVITDREKESLKAAGITLSPTAKEDLCTQRYYLYRVLTQPSERLYLSCTALDAAGKTCRPAGILSHLQKLYPGLALLETAGPGTLCSELEADRKLIGALREARAAQEENSEAVRFLETFLPGYCGSEARRKKAETLIGAAAFLSREESIGRAAARLLYGDVIEGNVTRLEDYAECPFRHFAKYGLRLSEFRAFTFENRDVGTLVHRAIENVFRAAGDRKLSLPALSDTERDHLTETCVEEAVLYDDSGLFRDTARNEWLVKKLSGIVKKSIRVMAEQLRRGDYIPAAAELRFGGRGSVLRQELPEGGVLELGGKTDRVDLCEDGDRVYVKIVDYKTGTTTWEPFRILSGSQIQLVLYLDAVTELLSRRYPGKEIVPGAIFYAPVTDPFLKRDKVTDAAASFLGTLKEAAPSGLMNIDPEAFRHLSEDPGTAGEILPVQVLKNGGFRTNDRLVTESRFDTLRIYVREKVAEAGTEILSGETAARPLKEAGNEACGFCPYGAACGFDKKTGGYRFRRNAKKKTEDVWAEIDRTAGDTEENGEGGEA